MQNCLNRIDHSIIVVFDFQTLLVFAYDVGALLNVVR